MHTESGDGSNSANPYESLQGEATPGASSKASRSWLLRVLVVVGIVGVLVALWLPTIRSAKPSAYRTQCQNNLRNIAIALISYADRHQGNLPPAYTVDANGKPLHSWRTLILPYLDQHELYDSIDLSKPWNDPANAVAFGTELEVFRCPVATLPAGHTKYLGVVGENACLHPTHGRKFSEITDGPGMTLIVVEVGARQSVHWMSPLDANEDLVMNIKKNGQLGHIGVFSGAFVDGTVRSLDVNMDREVLRSLCTVAGKEEVGSNDF